MVVRLSPALQLNYKAGSSIGTVYIIGSYDKLVSDAKVISEVKL